MPDFTYKIIEEIEEEICSLAEVKTFLRVTTEEDDDLITILTESAIDAAEKYIRFHLNKKKILASCEDRRNNLITLQHSPINEIVTITLGESEELQEQGEEDYDLLNLEQIKFKPHLKLKNLAITYIAGGNIPAAIKQGILIHIAEMYEQQNLSFGLIEAVRDLYQPYRKIIL